MHVLYICLTIIFVIFFEAYPIIQFAIKLQKDLLLQGGQNKSFLFTSKEIRRAKFRTMPAKPLATVQITNFRLFKYIVEHISNQFHASQVYSDVAQDLSIRSSLLLPPHALFYFSDLRV